MEPYSLNYEIRWSTSTPTAMLITPPISTPPATCATASLSNTAFRLHASPTRNRAGSTPPCKPFFYARFAWAKRSPSPILSPVFPRTVPIGKSIMMCSNPPGRKPSAWIWKAPFSIYLHASGRPYTQIAGNFQPGPAHSGFCHPARAALDLIGIGHFPAQTTGLRSRSLYTNFSPRSQCFPR